MLLQVILGACAICREEARSPWLHLGVKEASALVERLTASEALFVGGGSDLGVFNQIIALFTVCCWLIVPSCDENTFSS